MALLVCILLSPSYYRTLSFLIRLVVAFGHDLSPQFMQQHV